MDAGLFGGKCLFQRCDTPPISGGGLTFPRARHQKFHLFLGGHPYYTYFRWFLETVFPPSSACTADIHNSHVSCQMSSC